MIALPPRLFSLLPLWLLPWLSAQADRPGLGAIIRRALGLDPAIFALVEHSPHGLQVALTVVVLAGFSDALAQSVILFVNRVTPRRFAIAILLSTISHLAGYLLWTASIWLVGRYVFHQDAPFQVVARAVGLAYAPQILSFFVLTPYAGSFFGMVLAVWTLLATLVAVQVGLDLSLWQAVAASGLGWILIQLWRRTLGRPILALERWFQRRTVGVPLDSRLQEIPKHPLSIRIRQWWEQQSEKWSKEPPHE